MAKNKQKTFAQRAREIQNKYKRANTDPLEAADMEAELQALMAEQEAVRESMGLNRQEQPMQEFVDSGVIQDNNKYNTTKSIVVGYKDKIPIFDVAWYRGDDKLLTPKKLVDSKGISYNPSQVEWLSDFYKKAAINDSIKSSVSVKNIQQFNYGGKLMMQGDEVTQFIPSIEANLYPQLDTNLELDKLAAHQDDTLMKALTLPKDKTGVGRFLESNKQYAPYAISGLSNIASNLLLANMAKRNQPRVSAAMATPERINLEPQAEALRGQAGVAKNVASTNARNLGLNPMQAMASMSAAGTGIDRNLGDVLTNLYTRQEGANVGAANQFNLANAQSQNRANMMNAQLDQQALENRLGYTGAALGSLPGVMKDIRMDKADQATRDMYSTYFKSMGRNYMNEGDIWDNPKDGYRYVVRNNQLVKQGKSK